MIALTAAYEAEKNKQTGSRPFDVLKVKFATGDLYVGIADYTVANWGGGTRTVRAWVSEWGRVDDVIAQPLDDTAPLAGDMTVRLLCQDGQDGADTFWTRLIDPLNKPEQTGAELFIGFYDLDASTSPPVKKWSGMIKSWHWADELTLEVVLGDPSELIDQPIGNLITLTNFANADQDAVGMMEPIIYGSVLGSPCLAVDAGANSPVSVALTAAATVLYYSNTLTGFTATGDVYVDAEQITYTGKTTEVLNGVTHGKLTGLTRAAGGTTAVIHNVGSPVVQVQAAYKYLVAGHQCKAVPAVYVNDADGNPVKQLGTDYTVNLNDGGKTTISFSVLPKLVKQLNLSHTDTVSDTIGATSSALTISETQFGDGTFPRNQASPWYPGISSFVTFPALPAGATFVRQTVTVSLNYNTMQTAAGFDMGGNVACGNSGNSDTILIGQTVSLQLNSSTEDATLSSGFVSQAANGVNANGNVVIQSATRVVTYTIAPTITKTGAATGTGALTGNSAADTVIGGQVMADVDGYADDATGTYTGTALALIQKPADVIRHLLVTWMGLAFADFETSANLAVKMGTTYQINGPTLRQRGGRSIATRMAFESGCKLKFEAGKARLTFLERQLSPARIITTNEMFFLQGRAQSADVTRMGLDQIVNMLDVRYDRDWAHAAGGEDSYRAVSHATPNAWSQSQYGERGGPPGKFNLDFVTTSAHADAVRDTWMDVFAIRRDLVKVRLALDGLDVQHGDAVTVCDRSARVVTGLVLSADYQPGPKIDPACTLTLMVIEEAAE